MLLNKVLLIFAGKTPSLFRHDLIGLHANSKLNHRFTLSVNAMTKVRHIWDGNHKDKNSIGSALDFL